MRGAFVCQVFVNSHQIHVQLDAIERSLGGCCGQVSYRGIVFPHGILVAFFDLRNLSADRVQAIVVCVNALGALKKRVRLFDGVHSNLGLRSGKLQSHIFR